MEEVSREQMLAAFGRIPRPVREFVSGDEVGLIATALGQKYNLHIDASGALVNIVTKTLLGFIRPEELPKILSDQLLLEQTMSNALISDINSQVFIPLQARVRQASDAEKEERVLEQELINSAPPEPVVKTEQTLTEAESPNPKTPLPPPALEYVPQQVMLPGSPIPAPMPSSVEVPVAYQTLEQTVQTQPVVPQQHFVHTMPNVAPQQGWHPAAAVHIFVPTHGQSQPQPVPAIQVPQEPMATTWVPEITLENQAVIQPTQNTSAQEQSAPLAKEVPLTKSYGADPYREPV